MQRGSLSPCPQWLPPSSLRDVAYPRTQLDQRARLHQFFHLSRTACSPSSASAYQCQPQLLWCPARQGAGINGGWPAAIHLSPAKSNISSCPARTFGPGSGRTWRLPTTCAGELNKDHRRRIASNSFKFHWAMRLCIYHFAVLDPFEGLLLISLLIFQGFNPILLLSGQTKGLVDSPAANWITVAHRSTKPWPFCLGASAPSLGRPLRRGLTQQTMCWESWETNRGTGPLNGNVDPIEIHHSSNSVGPIPSSCSKIFNQHNSTESSWC